MTISMVANNYSCMNEIAITWYKVHELQLHWELAALFVIVEAPYARITCSVNGESKLKPQKGGGDKEQKEGGRTLHKNPAQTLN